jgi:hypothetical protein
MTVSLNLNGGVAITACGGTGIDEATPRLFAHRGAGAALLAVRTRGLPPKTLAPLSEKSAVATGIRQTAVAY